MRSRVTFGLSMAFDFDVYLIDEVMAVGDAQFRPRASRCCCRQALARQRHPHLPQHGRHPPVLQRRRARRAGGEVQVHEDIEDGIRAYQGAAAPVLA
jgi:capsular polysaccharide transport system ATP-binding protein